MLRFVTGERQRKHKRSIGEILLVNCRVPREHQQTDRIGAGRRTRLRRLVVEQQVGVEAKQPLLVLAPRHDLVAVQQAAFLVGGSRGGQMPEGLVVEVELHIWESVRGDGWFRPEFYALF